MRPRGVPGGCESRCYGLAPGETCVAVAREEGADFEQCLASVLEAMDADATCDRAPCSFGGAWTTPREIAGAAMSYLYARASAGEGDAFPEDASVPVVVTPGLYRDAGKRVCAVAAKDIARTYPDADQEHAAYLCLDVAYAHALLASRFGLALDDEELTLVDKIEHGETGGGGVGAGRCGGVHARGRSRGGRGAARGAVVDEDGGETSDGPVARRRHHSAKRVYVFVSRRAFENPAFDVRARGVFFKVATTRSFTRWPCPHASSPSSTRSRRSASVS